MWIICFDTNKLWWKRKILALLNAQREVEFKRISNMKLIMRRLNLLENLYCQNNNVFSISSFYRALNTNEPISKWMKWYVSHPSNWNMNLELEYSKEKNYYIHYEAYSVAYRAYCISLLNVYIYSIE